MTRFFLNFIKCFCSEIGEIGFPLPIVDGIEVINAEVVRGQVKYFLACSKYYLPFNWHSLDYFFVYFVQLFLERFFICLLSTHFIYLFISLHRTST